MLCSTDNAGRADVWGLTNYSHNCPHGYNVKKISELSSENRQELQLTLSAEVLYELLQHPVLSS